MVHLGYYKPYQTGNPPPAAIPQMRAVGQITASSANDLHFELAVIGNGTTITITDRFIHRMYGVVVQLMYLSGTLSTTGWGTHEAATALLQTEGLQPQNTINIGDLRHATFQNMHSFTNRLLALILYFSRDRIVLQQNDRCKKCSLGNGCMNLCVIVLAWSPSGPILLLGGNCLCCWIDGNTCAWPTHIMRLGAKEVSNKFMVRVNKLVNAPGFRDSVDHFEIPRNQTAATITKMGGGLTLQLPEKGRRRGDSAASQGSGLASSVSKMDLDQKTRYLRQVPAPPRLLSSSSAPTTNIPNWHLAKNSYLAVPLPADLVGKDMFSIEGFKNLIKALEKHAAVLEGYRSKAKDKNNGNGRMTFVMGQNEFMSLLPWHQSMLGGFQDDHGLSEEQLSTAQLGVLAETADNLMREAEYHYGVHSPQGIQAILRLRAHRNLISRLLKDSAKGGTTEGDLQAEHLRLGKWGQEQSTADFVVPNLPGQIRNRAPTFAEINAFLASAREQDGPTLAQILQLRDWLAAMYELTEDHAFDPSALNNFLEGRIAGG